MLQPLIHRIHKYSQVLKNLGFAMGWNISQRIFGIINIYVLVRLFSQTEFGQYQFILSILGILTVFNLPGMANAVMQSAARGFKKTFLRSLKPVLVSSLIGSILFAAGGFWYYLQNNADYTIALITIALFFPFSHGITQWRSVKVAEENFSFTLYIDVVSGIATTLGLCLLYWLDIDTLWAPIVVILSILSIQNLTMTIITSKAINPSAECEDGIVAYGIKTTLYSSLTIIANHIDKIVIYTFLSPAAMASYYTAERLSLLCKSVAQNIGAVLAPKFSRMPVYTPKLDKALKLLAFGLGSSIVIFAFTLMPPLFIMLFGTEYADAIPYAQGLLCSLMLGNYASLQHRFINSQQDEENYKRITITVAITRILSSITLIYFFGIWGAIASAFIFRLATIVTVRHAIKRSYSFNKI